MLCKIIITCLDIIFKKRVINPESHKQLRSYNQNDKIRDNDLAVSLRRRSEDISLGGLSLYECLNIQTSMGNAIKIGCS